MSYKKKKQLLVTFEQEDTEVEMESSDTTPTSEKKSVRRSKIDPGGVTWKSLVKAIAPLLMMEEKRGLEKRRHSYENLEKVQSFNRLPPNTRLEEHIMLPHLHELLEIFENHNPPAIKVQSSSRYAPTKYIEREPGSLNLPEFKETIAGVLGTNEFDDQLEKLFTKLDTSCDGYVDWDEFITYMLLQYRENDYMRTKKELPFLMEPKIRHIVLNRQETTTKIAVLENPLRYVTVSKEGAWSIWNKNLHLEKTYIMDQEEEDIRGQKRRFKMWVTDACYMKNCSKLAVASTCRDIRFYDVTTNNCLEEYNFYGLPHVPMCIDYWYDVKDKNSPSLLIYGTDAGAIYIMTFAQPVTQLFSTQYKPTGHGVTKVFYQDMSLHTRWMTYSSIDNVHPDIVTKIMYMAENESIISSCSSSRTSLVIGDSQRKKKAYVFNIQKGVDHFDYNKNLNILVTGSADHTVRIWNPYVTNKPIAVLGGHVTGVIGVVIHEPLEQIFSYSKDGTVKVWDVKEHACLQTVLMKFPSTANGRLPEHGQFPVHLQPLPYNTFVIACSDYIALIKCGQSNEPKDSMPTTHKMGLCGAIYNPYFKQVVTCSDDSTICVWDADSGNKAILFTNAHGEEEITAMAFDSNWRRLVTGARNGTIKIWNHQNGHNLHKLQPVDEAEVTGIIPFNDKKYILAVGWNRKITLYDDSEPDNHYIEADTNWKAGQVHKDDILAVAYCAPNLLCTASYDGEIIVWSLETEKIFLRLRTVKLNRGSHQGSRSGSRNSSRPNSRHQKHHRPHKGQQAPVDRLLFLQARADAKMMESAILLSSEAGTLRWWSIFGKKHEMGYFYASECHDESILALNTCPSNYFLVTGDTQGQITLWDISDYCVKPEEHRIKTRPPISYTWRAHDSTVVGVEYIEHRYGGFILSASTDKTARMWTIDGKYIGVFGQKFAWNLMIPETWAHPRNPWSSEEEEQKETEKNNKEQQTKNNSPTKENPTDIQNGVENKEMKRNSMEIDPSVNIEKSAIITKAVSSILTNSANHSKEHTYNMGNHDETAKTEKLSNGDDEIPVLERGESLVADDDIGVLTLPSERNNRDKLRKSKSVSLDACHSRKYSSPEFIPTLDVRSHTFHFGANGKDPTKSVIGIKAERELVRKRLDRQERRDNFGEVDLQKTSRYGKFSSPFHALYTAEMEDVSLPSNLPLSPRMMFTRGYTTFEKQNTMDYFGEENNNRIQPKTEPKRKILPKLPAIKANKSNAIITRNLHTS